MIKEKIEFSREGYEKLEKDLDALTERRKEAVVNLRTAREMGDLSENAAYKAARWELSAVDRQMRRVSYLLKMGKVVETRNEGIVDFGRRITLNDGKKEIIFTLVGSFESDPSVDKLSIASPVGRAIMGKKRGEKVEVITPSGYIHYTIVNIE